MTPPVDDTSLAGSRFGDYQILEELGAGGMGKVYRARDLTLERVVALKTLPEAHLKDPVFVQRFLKEARAAARLNHPNIVQIYNFGSVDGTFYLAMEFVDGHTLGHHLRERRFSENEALDLMRQVCRALAVAHAEGLVHRDIKPDNLMLTERGEVKLVDLGIAKRIDEDQAITQTGYSVGTPHYISPEQIRGQKDIDARADIYSLGATLYHLVTGHRPFEGSSGAHVMSMHLVDPLPDPRRYVPELSEGICRVLRKMMAKNREERYPDIAILEVDLHRIRAGQTPRPAEPSMSAVETSILASQGVRSAQHAPFDVATLAKIEENLAASIGPMARVIVRKTARTAVSLDALCEELARQLAPGSDREAFCAKCLACDKPSKSSSLGAAAGPEKTPPSGGRMPASSPVSAAPSGTGAPRAASDPGLSRAPAPWNDADLATVEVELTKQIGPLARVLLKKALKNATTPGDLVSSLEKNIPGEEGRRAFRAAVRRLTL